MNKKQVLQKLKEDEHYYGTFGKQYLSNSDISTLLNNPLQLGKPSTPNPNFLMGGYFHTAILEPEKLASFKIVESTSRNTKDYKEISGGEMCLLQSEADNINLITDKIMALVFRIFFYMWDILSNFLVSMPLLFHNLLLSDLVSL